ncbi:MAG: DUF790 family protein [Myxococcales bacterium]|nr:DUF790 family protein [Myxococcales bacterium]
MLTADLVRATRRGGELKLSGLNGKDRERALEIAEALLTEAGSLVGRTRDEVKEGLGQVWVEGREKKLLDGLSKLVDDACEFQVETELQPMELRARLFGLATELRRELPPGEAFDRHAVLSRVATELELSEERVEGALFADLKGAHVLQRVEQLTPVALLERYELSQRQAVLLRAVRVRARVRCHRPGDYRRLFNALKFRRLLFRLEPAESGYSIELDGPFSLFESVTKYGLNLALALPLLEQAAELELEAELRWGKSREPLVFRYQRRADTAPAWEDDEDELAAFVKSFEKLDSGWQVKPAEVLLEVPGLGVLVPDLCFSPPEGSEPVYFELLGFWSREAVWKRIELARSGVGAKLLFGVSERLRVSREVLSDLDDAALYVFKGTPNARGVLRQLEELLQ